MLLARGASPAQEMSGDWGGAHARLSLTATGGTVEFDCAHGELASAILLDPKSRFDVAGTYVEEHGGPVRRDEPAKPRPVRYAGQVSGSRMRLTVTRTDTKARIGAFEVERGREAELMKCR